MPTVPIYDQQVQEASTPAVRDTLQSPIEAFGGGQVASGPGEAIRGLSTEAYKLAEEEKKKADNVSLISAHADLLKEKQRITYDPKTGALSKKEQDAFGVLDEYNPQFDEAAKRISGRLTPDQAARFKAIEIKEKTSFNETLQKHIFSEAGKFQENTITFGVKAQQQEAILNATDEDKIAATKKAQYDILDQHTGISSEERQVRRTMAASETNMGVIKQLLAGHNDVQAKAFFEKIEKSPDEFFGDARAHAKSMIEGASSDNEAYRQAQAMWTQSGGNYKKAAGMIEEKVSDLGIQKKALSELDHLNARAEHIDRTVNEKKMKDASFFVEKNLALPPSFQTMTFDQKRETKNYLNNLLAGKKPDTDWEVYYDARGEASSPDPKMQEKFMNDDLFLKYRNVLADGEFKEIVHLQASMREKDGKDKELVNDWRTQHEIFTDVAKSAGINPSPKSGSDEAKKIVDLKKQLGEEYVRFQTKTGKKPTNKDVEDMANMLITPVITDKGWFWDTKKPMFETDIKKVPMAYRMNYSRVLQNAGKEVTEDAILELYNKKK